MRTLDATAHADALAFACQQLNHLVRVAALFRASLLTAPVLHTSTNTEVLPSLQARDIRVIRGTIFVLSLGKTW